MKKYQLMMMTTNQCLNCGNDFEQHEKFCSQCGQKADTHRLTLGHFLHDFFHAFTHADKSIFKLLKDLIIRPGTVAREYIEGKRKKYFNPFTFFLLLMAVFVVSNKLVKTEAAQTKIPEGVYRIPNQQARERTIATITRGNEVRQFTGKNGNIMAMIAIPVIAFVFWICYYRRPYNYAEHLTANLFFTAVANIFFTILVFPLQRLAQGSPYAFLFTFLGLVMQVFYYTWAYTGFFKIKTFGGTLKTIGVSILGVIVWGFFSMTLMAIYIYQSWDFYQFFVRLFGGGR